MDLKTSVGLCAKVQGELVIIHNDVDKLKENQVVVLIGASDFENFTDEMKTLIKFVESAQTVMNED
jgi:predicted nucleotide-binding protein (sugar kinase/HSP70/actin superfamily)